MSECRCGHVENHCSHCGEHFVVVVLREDHEARCDARPAVMVA